MERFLKYKCIDMNVIKFTLCYIIIFLISIYLLLSANVELISYKKNIALDYLPEKYNIPYQIFNSKQKLLSIIHTFKYPIVIKPNWCSSQGKNVYKVNNKDELINIINNFPHREMMIQKFNNHQFEGSILYEKYPFSKTGEITVFEKIRKNHKIDNYNAHDCIIANITNKTDDRLKIIVNNISRKIPDLNVARYDIKYNSLEDLRNGNFKILEVNGTLGIDFRFHYNLPNYNILSKIYYFTRWILKRIFIGFINTTNPTIFFTNLRNRLIDLPDFLMIRQNCKLERRIIKLIYLIIFYLLLLTIFKKLKFIE